MRNIFLIVILVAACAVSEPRSASVEGGIWIANNETQATLPFTLVDNRILLEARINGRGPFVMAFDTGGSNIVTPEVAEALGLELRDPFAATGAGEGASQAWHTQVAEVAAGDIHMTGLPFLVLPLEPIRSAIGFDRLDGLFGHELLRQYVTRIDYDAGEISFSIAGHAPRNWFEGEQIAFEFSGNLPRIRAHIDEVEFDAIIDTGDRSSLTLFEPFASQRGFPGRSQTRAVTGWGVGGPILADVDAMALRIGSYDLPEIATRAPLAEWSALRGRDLDGSIGNGVMRRFHVTFDYGRRLVIIRPNRQFGAPDPFDRSGAWLVQSSDRAHVVVHSVDASSPAFAAGLRGRCRSRP